MGTAAGAGNLATATMQRLQDAAMRGLGRFGRGGDKRVSKSAQSSLEAIGLAGIGYGSTDEELADWEDRLWHDQDDYLEPAQREWQQHLHYVANEQFIAYHRERRGWIPRRAVPWRIRASYNVCQKAVNVRVGRLTENKPTVSVQAATADLADVEKAEYKQSLFWYLWETLRLHYAVVRARRWATKCGAGFLKVGWDPDGGLTFPVTVKKPRYETVLAPPTDPTTGQPIPGAEPAEQQVYTGQVDEFYVDAKGNVIGPVEEWEQDPDTLERRKVRHSQPEECDTYTEGQVTVGVRSPFNVRYDKYVDDPSDSWYVQDAEILPASKIIAALPGIEDKLRDARPASEDEKTVQWSGLNGAGVVGSAISRAESRRGEPRSDVLHGQIDREYLVRETYIFPRNKFLKRQWGPKGALLVTVGGVLVHKAALPEWAIQATPFIQLSDIPEEGNHYSKSFLRDVVPLQDDINRSRSQMAERSALLSRLLLGAPQNHGISFKLMSGMPGVLVTYRTPQHVPTPLSLGNADPATKDFYESSLEAVQSVASLNDASTGKLPSAGIAAKAIYALQYADERSIAEASTLQDIALKKLAVAMDWVTRVEYTAARKIRIVGEDQGFLAEREILPEHLDSDVDYFFTPGSMLSKQKEAVKNELLELRSQGLIDDATVKKFLSSAVPDAFRESYNLQEAHARRMLSDALEGAPDGEQPTPIQPNPWDDAGVHRMIIEEFLLSAKWDATPQQQKQVIMQLWQAYALMQQQQQMAMQSAQAPQPGAQPGAQGQLGAQQQQPFEGAQGASALEQQATQAMQQPAPPGSTPPGQ